MILDFETYLAKKEEFDEVSQEVHRQVRHTIRNMLEKYKELQKKSKFQVSVHSQLTDDNLLDEETKITDIDYDNVHFTYLYQSYDYSEWETILLPIHLFEEEDAFEKLWNKEYAVWYEKNKEALDKRAFAAVAKKKAKEEKELQLLAELKAKYEDKNL